MNALNSFTMWLHICQQVRFLPSLNHQNFNKTEFFILTW
jgi:hypothetical protein